MGKTTISMAIFHCYVSSPEGKCGSWGRDFVTSWHQKKCLSQPTATLFKTFQRSCDKPTRCCDANPRARCHGSLVMSPCFTSPNHLIPLGINGLLDGYYKDVQYTQVMGHLYQPLDVGQATEQNNCISPVVAPAVQKPRKRPAYATFGTYQAIW